jgi:hypothetical protein
MQTSLPELFAMLKYVEVEIKKEYQVLMVNKSTNFMNMDKRGNFKKGGKPADSPPKQPKYGPNTATVCFYCTGNTIAPIT